MQPVYRKQIVEGVKIPGIIRNMHYFYTDLALFSDGTFSCWELVDLEGLERRVDSGWISLSVPDGNSLDVHHLGRYEIETGRWIHDKKSYRDKIQRTLVSMNPKLENLYVLGSLHKSTFDDRRVLQSSSGIDFALERGFIKDRVDGESLNIFIKVDGELLLSTVTIYEDGACVLQFGDQIFYHGDQDGLKAYLQLHGEVSAKSGSTLRLDDLGEVTVAQTHEHVSLPAKLGEIDEVFKKIEGKKTLLEECREIYLEYLQHPYEGLREKLRDRYERIPEHERIYLGDMDTRDSDYKRILYDPGRKREV